MSAALTFEIFLPSTAAAVAAAAVFLYKATQGGTILQTAALPSNAPVDSQQRKLLEQKMMLRLVSMQCDAAPAADVDAAVSTHAAGVCVCVCVYIKVYIYM